MDIAKCSVMRRLLLVLALLATAAPGAAADRVELDVTSRLVSHDVRSLDPGGTRPSIFAYTTELAASSSLPAEPGTDVLAPAVRLDREELAPNADPGTPLTWSFAGRGAPVKLNAQDAMPAYLLTAARANPYGTSWYQRQETARDLWSWGGVMRGGLVSGEERSQNAIFGLGPAAVAHPERPAKPAAGELAWVDRTLVRSAVAVEHDPVTGESFEGTFWGVMSRPSLEVVGGDLVAETDVPSPPLVLELPVRPAGLMYFSTPASPPGVEIEWSRAIDFNARTVTVTATVKAGSVWPESGFDEKLDEGGDPTLPRWTWTPWLFFMGWDYGDLVNGGPIDPAALAPGRVRPDGSFEAPRELRPDGLPELPPGLLDASLPPGTEIETAWGERAEVGGVRQPAPPGPSPTPHALGEGTPLTAVATDGGLELGAAGASIGTLAIPAVRIDGEHHLLGDDTVLDRWVEPGAWIVELHEVGGVFLSTLVTKGEGYAASYLWDAHSTDGADHDVQVHTLVDPAIGGDDGDVFREPFYTGDPYTTEQKVPQGVLDFPVGSLLHGWIGSLPAIEAVDQELGGSILHMQLWPNLGGNVAPDALNTFAYLERDHGTYHPDAEAAIADEEPIVGTDVAMDHVNAYSGTIWDRSMLPFFSWFYVTPPS